MMKKAAVLGVAALLLLGGVRMLLAAIPQDSPEGKAGVLIAHGNDVYEVRCQSGYIMRAEYADYHYPVVCDGTCETIKIPRRIAIGCFEEDRQDGYFDAEDVPFYWELKCEDLAARHRDPRLRGIRANTFWCEPWKQS